jgi:hypothetical protein
VGDVTIDRTAPSVSLGADRSAGAVSGDGTIEVAFLAPTDATSGLDGFSYVWDESPGTVPDTVKEVEEGASGASSPALPDGNWYFHLRARDNAGNWGQPLHLGPFPIDANAPATVELSPLAPFQLRPAIGLSWSVEAGAAAELRYRAAPFNGDFGAYAGLPTGAGATTASVTAAPGSTVCFSGRSTDSAGNVSGWSLDACTALPLKAASLTRRGAWSKRSASGHYARGYLASSTRGASLARSGLVAQRLALVATKCRGCGTVAAYWNGRLLKRVSLDAPSTRKAQIITLATFPAGRSGTLRIVVLTSGKSVRVEGLGVSRL